MWFEGYFKKLVESDDYSELILLMSRVLLNGVYMWPGPKSKAKKLISLSICLGSLLFVIYGVVMFIVVNIEKLDEIIFAISSMSNLYQGTSKLILVYYYSDKIFELLEIFWKYYWPSTLDETVHNDLKTRYLIVFRGAITFLAVVSVFLIGFFVVALIATIQGKDLPYKSVYPFDWSYSPLFETIFVIESLTYICIVPFSALGFDLLFLGICYTFMTQYIILGNVIKHFGTGRMEEFVEKINNEECKEELRNGGDLEKAYLRMCINQHHLLVRTSKMMEDIFHVSNFSELCSTCAALCISSFIMVAADMGKDQIVVMLSYLNAYFLQLAIYCAIGNELSHQANLLPDYIYDINWYDIDDVGMRKDIAFMMIGAQKPVKLTALKFFQMNLATFIKVLRFTFSLYTLLSTIAVYN